MSGNGFRNQGVNRVFSLGILWGTAEASLGHILHWVPVPGLAGLVMVPIGLLFMSRVFRDTGRPAAVAAVAAVAAAVKLVDALLPGRGIMMAVRPALAILSEGLLVAALFAALPSLVRRKA
jgi:hypothetical protein